MLSQGPLKLDIRRDLRVNLDVTQLEGDLNILPECMCAGVAWKYENHIGWDTVF